MKNTKLFEGLAKTYHKVAFQAKKHSPEIYLISGLVVIIGGVVYACKQSTKLPEVLEESQERVEHIQEVAADPEQTEITVGTKNKELAKAYAHTGVELVKLYAGPVVVLATGGSLILVSHKIIKGRNAALSAVYTGLSTTFNNYRKRVAEKYGTEVEEELRYGITTKTVKEKVTDENGEVHTVKNKVAIVTPGPESDYIRYITNKNCNWDEETEYVELFLNKTQRYANDILCTRGYLYLNTVYEMLGVKQSKLGQEIGWLYRRDNPDGDNQVIFKVKKVQIPVSNDPDDGYQVAYMIDFNVDGDIHSRMEDDDYFEQ